MQKARLTLKRSRSQPTDRVEVSGPTPERPLTLLDGRQLEPNRIGGLSLSENRKISFADDGDFRVAAHCWRVRHQNDGDSIARYLDSTSTPGLRRECSGRSTDGRAVELITGPIGCGRNFVLGLRENSPRGFVEELFVCPGRDVYDPRIVARDQIRRAVKTLMRRPQRLGRNCKQVTAFYRATSQASEAPGQVR